jgi:hypothetical protein
MPLKPGWLFNKKASLIQRGLKVARAGFEPTQSEPKSEVLPLDDRAFSLKNFKKRVQK